MNISKSILIFTTSLTFCVEFVFGEPTFGGEHVHIKVLVPKEMGHISGSSKLPHKFKHLIRRPTKKNQAFDIATKGRIHAELEKLGGSYGKHHVRPLGGQVTQGKAAIKQKISSEKFSHHLPSPQHLYQYHHYHDNDHYQHYQHQSAQKEAISKHAAIDTKVPIQYNIAYNRPFLKDALHNVAESGKLWNHQHEYHTPQMEAVKVADRIIPVVENPNEHEDNTQPDHKTNYGQFQATVKTMSYPYFNEPSQVNIVELKELKMPHRYVNERSFNNAEIEQTSDIYLPNCYPDSNEGGNGSDGKFAGYHSEPSNHQSSYQHVAQQDLSPYRNHDKAEWFIR